MLPVAHETFLNKALPILISDPRLVGVAAAGSWITKNMDEFSDIDLVVVAAREHYEEVMRDRMRLIAGLGTLLSGFTGEHVGEPRVVICLFGDPLIHVDLKFITLEDLDKRIEDPVVLWEREGALSARMAQSEARHPMPDLQWIEDRMWVWAHYAALRLARGELFEVIDFLAFLRGTVLGPLILVKHGHLPRGVRRLETAGGQDAVELRKTLCDYDRADCGRAVLEALKAYQRLRSRLAPEGLVLKLEAERTAMDYLDKVLKGTVPA